MYPTSIKDFTDLIHKEMKSIKVEGVLIEDLQNNFKAVEKQLKDVEFIADIFIITR